MAKIENLINEIPNQRLRDELLREVEAIKKNKKFGLVFEEHVPEIIQLPNLRIITGLNVIKRLDEKREIYYVEEILADGKASIRATNKGVAREIVDSSELVAIKRFGEPIYPALKSIDRLTRSPDKPYHTLINSENYHALQLLLYCYTGRVDVIYIDPPYNTGAKDWKYNNDYVDINDQYRHSKWLSMMKKRLKLAKRLLKKDGVLIVTIDDNELYHLGCLLEELYQEYDRYIVTIEHNKRGRRGKNFAKTNEWAIYLVPKGKNIIQEQDMGETIGGEQRNLRRTGSGSKRYERYKKFYPIWVNEKTLEVVKAGDFIPKDAPWSVERKDGLISIWPIDEDGVEKNWHYGLKRTRQCIKDKTLEARPQDYGIQVYYTLRQKNSKKFKTVWSDPLYDASTYGTELLKDILGGTSTLDYPKSLYAVHDCLEAVVGKKQDALILDFFAGSGTTYHATAMLNAEDGGKRRCILVTNNEVSEKESNLLKENGHYPGSPEYEKQGICNSVTWPRCKFVTQGQRDDGTPLQGSYLDGDEFSDGFIENIEYFQLDFLDPNEVAYGEKFDAIYPILWLIANCHGNRGEASDRDEWLMPDGCQFAILINEHSFSKFKKKIAERSDIQFVFLITDSEEAFREMSSEISKDVTTVMLYKSYLDNFIINTEKTT